VSGQAYETVIDALSDLGRVYQSGEHRATSRCPAHEDRSPSLSVRYKDGKVLLNCFSGCDWRDVVASLDLHPSALFDGKGSRGYKADNEAEARYRARKAMTPVQKVLDDLLHLPDFGERLCKGIGRHRPELYLMDKHEMTAQECGDNCAVVTDAGLRHVAHLLGGVSCATYSTLMELGYWTRSTTS